LSERILQIYYSGDVKAIFPLEGMKRWKMVLAKVDAGVFYFYDMHFHSVSPIKECKIFPPKLLTFKAKSHLKL